MRSKSQLGEGDQSLADRAAVEGQPICSEKPVVANTLLTRRYRLREYNELGGPHGSDSNLLCWNALLLAVPS